MDVKVIVFNLFTLTEWVKHFLYSHDHLFVCLFDLTVILLEYSRFYSVQVLGAEESILIIDIVFQVFKYISFNKTMTQLSATLNNVTYHFSLIQGFHYILIFSSPLACCIYSPPPLSPLPPHFCGQKLMLYCIQKQTGDLPETSPGGTDIVYDPFDPCRFWLSGSEIELNFLLCQRSVTG